MSNQVVRGLLTACFASFGDSANPSILLSVLGAEEWATDAPVNGLRQEMDWEPPPRPPHPLHPPHPSVAHLRSGTSPLAQSGPVGGAAGWVVGVWGWMWVMVMVVVVVVAAGGRDGETGWRRGWWMLCL